MNSSTPFKIKKGEVVSDCMPETQKFIQQNVNFFHHKFKSFRDVLADSEPLTFISFEDQWSFAYRVDKVELGKISDGTGLIVESEKCTYDDVVSSF